MKYQFKLNQLVKTPVEGEGIVIYREKYDGENYYNVFHTLAEDDWIYPEHLLSEIQSTNKLSNT